MRDLRTEMAAEGTQLAQLRDRLREGLQARVPGVIVNNSLAHRLPNNLHVTFDGVDGATLLIASATSPSLPVRPVAQPLKLTHVLRAVLGDRCLYVDSTRRFRPKTSASPSMIRRWSGTTELGRARSVEQWGNEAMRASPQTPAS